MSIDRNSWPEFVYRFVEHYYWERQHLGPNLAAFHRKIRSQEVPLNFLFNILLYALSPAATRSLLSMTGVVASRGAVLDVQNAQDASFTQADVQLDSPRERVFIELKVRARTGIEQAQKYALLHAKLAFSDLEPKAPSLLFITEKAFARHWAPARKAPADGEALANALAVEPLAERLSRNPEARSLEKIYRALCSDLRVSFVTWQQIGDHLLGCSSPGVETQEAFVRDFLADLSRRGLWAAT